MKKETNFNAPKLAVVTITMNGGFKLKEWYEHYLEYKDDIMLHIIVDNASKADYLSQVKELFKDSIIIERTTNGGCTGAYNDGIKYALADCEVDYIALVGSDIKLSDGALRKCILALNDDSDLGMVAPILLHKDSMIIADYGSTISNKLTMIPYMDGVPYSKVKIERRKVEMLTGGLNVATRLFYEKVGLQDENIFMYSDEVDMALRAKKLGFKMANLGDAVAWHQHINENKKDDRRHPYSRYLIARNKVYLAQKHFGFAKRVYVAFYFLATAIKQMIICIFKGKMIYLKDAWWQMLGAFNGLIGNMTPNKYSHL